MRCVIIAGGLHTSYKIHDATACRDLKLLGSGLITLQQGCAFVSVLSSSPAPPCIFMGETNGLGFEVLRLNKNREGDNIDFITCTWETSDAHRAVPHVKGIKRMTEEQLRENFWLESLLCFAGKTQYLILRRCLLCVLLYCTTYYAFGLLCYNELILCWRANLYAKRNCFKSRYIRQSCQYYGVRMTVLAFSFSSVLRID